MAVLLRIRGYEFYLRTSDGGEPPHVHVRGNAGRAKLWLAPEVTFAACRGYARKQREEIERVAATRRTEWLEAWTRFFAR
ncbi:MAG TPA: DUF4160 domain-containing protein [Candidatus Limnocylindria bacterium]|nr:DUF4160 domain-containing protein [Candidatus Limnocylindria bacterium]